MWWKALFASLLIMLKVHSDVLATPSLTCGWQLCTNFFLTSKKEPYQPQCNGQLNCRSLLSPSHSISLLYCYLLLLLIGARRNETAINEPQLYLFANNSVIWDYLSLSTMMVQCAAQASALRAGGPGHNARGHRRSGRGTNRTVNEKSSSAPGVLARLRERLLLGDNGGVRICYSVSRRQLK